MGIKVTYWDTPPAQFRFEGYKSKTFKHELTAVLYILFVAAWHDRMEINR